ncbi:hypothetical protein A2311_02200 [candidate division WOR-1 bacterium RIFOXYB2_FULL_48_7]|uniref:4Fe-4S ferredoxin-type domain-containing protein n=1 Tax=candidate division WOR-1 bacterium RIFOXYB2_FULL_48_7 TaxID=1802583 RepID=A0A1F4TKE5_UNCSA|nr:MAG: hypothetical protein A2311_02200 [candidate division WOR-1 bacterium RIFOXYB2_FULL_48_7]
MVITGIKPAVEAAGGEMVYFEASGTTEVSPGIRIAKAVIEADVIINLPKLKTHGLTLYTGAVKNMFGSVPGFLKAKCHASHPHPRDFANLIVNIYKATKPQLTIMDAIIGMEGDGPSAGQPRTFGAIIASADGVALDAAAAALIGFKPDEIITTTLAGQQKLGNSNLSLIEIIGGTINEFAQLDWNKPAGLYQRIKWLPDSLFRLATPIINLLKANPVIIQDKCKRCHICLKSCPVKTIFQDSKTKTVTINLKKCINCYCCHELCPYQAIKIEKSWILRRLGIGTTD